jgi:PAS domain S-box-containing protein
LIAYVTMNSNKFISNSNPEPENLMQAILDNAAEGIVLISNDHTVLLFNTAIKDSLKSYFTKELEVGDDYRDFVVEESMQLYLESFEKAINGTSISVEHETRNTDVTIWFLYTVNPVYDRQKKLIGVTLTATNITDRKKLELEREEIISHLLERNNDLLEFSQIVSHSVRAPLANLLGLINLIADDLPTAEQHFIFDGIRKSSERFDEVINDLNGILQIRESISEKKIRVYFNRVLSNVKKNISNSQKSKVTIKSDFTPANNILTIQSYINDIFYNLISNSIKFAKPHVHPVIKIWTQKIDGAIVIYFKDNGIGIDVERHRDRMFGLYQKFNLTAEGRGVGLFLTKTQVEKLNGKIEVESDLDCGAMFKLILPQ